MALVTATTASGDRGTSPVPGASSIASEGRRLWVRPFVAIYGIARDERLRGKDASNGVLPDLRPAVGRRLWDVSW